MANILDTMKPICYTSIIGGAVWNYRVKGATKRSRRGGLTQNGVHLAELSRIGRNFSFMKDGTPQNVLGVGSQLLEEQSYAISAITNLEWSPIEAKTTLTGKVGKPIITAMFTSWLKEKVRNIAIKLNTSLFGKKSTKKLYQKVGLSTISMVSGMITELRIWQQCLENATILNLHSNPTKGAFDN